MLARRGRGEEALPLLEEAHAMATEHGLEHLVRQVEPLVRALRRGA